MQIVVILLSFKQLLFQTAFQTSTFSLWFLKSVAILCNFVSETNYQFKNTVKDEKELIPFIHYARSLDA